GSQDLAASREVPLRAPPGLQRRTTGISRVALAASYFRGCHLGTPQQGHRAWQGPEDYLNAGPAVARKRSSACPVSRSGVGRATNETHTAPRRNAAATWPR